MKITEMPELQALPQEARIRVLATVAPSIVKDHRVWGGYVAQIALFVLIFFVLFPDAQPRLILILAYAIPTLYFVKKTHEKVTRERIMAFLDNERSA